MNIKRKLLFVFIIMIMFSNFLISREDTKKRAKSKVYFSFFQRAPSISLQASYEEASERQNFSPTFCAQRAASNVPHRALSNGMGKKTSLPTPKREQ